MADRIIKREPPLLRWLGVALIAGSLLMLVSITLATLPPYQPPEPNTFRWSRVEHQLDETKQVDGGESWIVYYHQKDQPFYRAKYYKGTEYAYQLGVDMDQDGKIDFTVLDKDGDTYLDFDFIFCHENCEHVIERALKLFRGKLKLEKGV